MRGIDWSYLRKGWKSCVLAQEFLASHDLAPATVVDARTTRYGADDLAAVLKGVKSIHVVRGKKRTHIDLAKDAPGAADLAAVLLGPTGNLRAPTLKQGATMLVGFSPEFYDDVLRREP